MLRLRAWKQASQRVNPYLVDEGHHRRSDAPHCVGAASGARRGPVSTSRVLGDLLVGDGSHAVDLLYGIVGSSRLLSRSDPAPDALEC